MHYPFISFLILNTCLAFIACSENANYQNRLINLEKQLDRIELQLNDSFNQILQKLDTNNQKILDSIKSLHNSQLTGSYLFPPIISFKRKQQIYF